MEENLILLPKRKNISENYLQLDPRRQKDSPALISDIGWTTGLRCWQMTKFLSSPRRLERLWGPPSLQFNGVFYGGGDDDVILTGWSLAWLLTIS